MNGFYSTEELFTAANEVCWKEMEKELIMLTHEFGIMPKAPGPGERFDCYEPKKYRCVSVPDEAIEPLLEAFRCGKTYWHTLDRPELGLANWGITLIPPETLDAYLAIVWKKPGLTELAALFVKAKTSDSFVIHFGI